MRIFLFKNNIYIWIVFLHLGSSNMFSGARYPGQLGYDHGPVRFADYQRWVEVFTSLSLKQSGSHRQLVHLMREAHSAAFNFDNIGFLSKGVQLQHTNHTGLVMCPAAIREYENSEVRRSHDLMRAQQAQIEILEAGTAIDTLLLDIALERRQPYYENLQEGRIDRLDVLLFVMPHLRYDFRIFLMLASASKACSNLWMVLAMSTRFSIVLCPKFKCRHTRVIQFVNQEFKDMLHTDAMIRFSNLNLVCDLRASGQQQLEPVVVYPAKTIGLGGNNCYYKNCPLPLFSLDRKLPDGSLYSTLHGFHNVVVRSTPETPTGLYYNSYSAQLGLSFDGRFALKVSPGSPIDICFLDAEDQTRYSSANVDLYGSECSGVRSYGVVKLSSNGYVSFAFVQNRECKVVDYQFQGYLCTKPSHRLVLQSIN
jgi:hypothetical protein